MKKLQVIKMDFNLIISININKIEKINESL